MEDNLTEIEVIAELKKIFPDASADALKQDAALIKDKKTLEYVKINKDLPENWMQQFGISPKQHLDASGKNNFGQYAADSALAALTFLPMGKSGAIGRLTKAIFAKKAAEEGVTTAAKMSLKKKAAIGAVGLYAGSKAAGSIGNAVNGNKTDPAAGVQSQAETDMANAVAQADAAGLNVNNVINTPAGQQLNLNSGNLPAFMAKFGLGTSGLSGVGNVGVTTGKQVEGGNYVGSNFVKFSKNEIVSLADWGKTFPADAAGLASVKQKFVDAGVLNPTDGLDRIKSAWDTYGKMSLEYSRAGNNLSPWQILDLQKGLSGSGSQTSTTIDTTPISEGDVRTLTKRQLSQSLGLSNIDDKTYKDILAIVRKNETKKPTTTVRTTTGTTTRTKTTQGYGQSDVLSDVEAYAKTDPRYADFQTSNVFGDALVKSLGLKS